MNDPFITINPNTNKREFTLVALGAVILVITGIIVWQWIVTINEIEAITEGELNRYSNFLPQQGLDDIKDLEL
ncbi:MAG: hypothetical protein O2794_00820 [bacterium]|nr:hypothetical protein [bacterium]